MIARPRRKARGTLDGTGAASGRPPIAIDSNVLQFRSNGVERTADIGSECGDSYHADHGDQSDEHCVFDEGRARLVAAETMDYLAHAKILQTVAQWRVRRRTQSGALLPAVSIDEAESRFKLILLESFLCTPLRPIHYLRIGSTGGHQGNPAGRRLYSM